MTKRRTEISLTTFQALLLLAGTCITIILAFFLGVIAGKGDIEGINLLEKDVRSEVVKMKVESPPQEYLPPENPARQEKSAVMNNTTSRPVITFYDTLTNSKTGVSRPATAEKKVKEEPSGKIYTIQVGAMKDKIMADAMAAKLKKAGYSVYITPPGRSAYYKVRLGTFRNRDDARKEAARIGKNEGVQAMAVEK